MGVTLQTLLRSPLFEPRLRHRLTLKAYMDLTIQRMHAIFAGQIVSNEQWLGQAQQSEFSRLCEWMGYFGAFDYALHSSLVDHMIAVDALLNHASPTQIAHYRDEAIGMHKVYSFGCTEVGGGSDVRNTQTTVTYHRQTHRLILDSPSPEACKCWIGNALYAAQVVMVLGRLIVDDEDQGLHWFRVVIRQRENGRLRKGVKIMACDPKGGIHANQVAAIRFCQLELSVDALLQRHAHFNDEGTFVSDLPRDRRFIAALKTFLQERVLFLTGIRQNAGLAAHLSYRFACHRQLHRDGGTVALLSQPLFRQRLYAVQLKALALRLLEQAVIRRFEAHWAQVPRRQELHVLAALSKAVGAWMGLDVIRLCRELCGSQGFHQFNQIATQVIDCEVGCTFAGDSTMMAYQVIKDALARPRFILDAPTNLGQQVEATLVARCATDATFTHEQALGLAYARALDLVIEEAEAQHLLDSPTLDDLINSFAAPLHPWAMFSREGLARHATQAQVEMLAAWLKPPQCLISAYIDAPDYARQFTHKLYEEQ